MFQSFFCILVVGGVILVVKPPILFPPEQHQLESSNGTTAVIEPSDNSSSQVVMNCRMGKSDADAVSSKFTSDYWVGLAFGFGFCVSSAMCNVLPPYCKRVAANVFMFWAGLGCVAVGFLLPSVVGLCMKTVYYATAMGNCVPRIYALSLCYFWHGF